MNRQHEGGDSEFDRDPVRRSGPGSEWLLLFGRLPRMRGSLGFVGARVLTTILVGLLSYGCSKKATGPTGPTETPPPSGAQLDVPGVDAVFPFDGNSSVPQRVGSRPGIVTSSFGTPAESAQIEGVPWISQKDPSIGCPVLGTSGSTGPAASRQ